MSVSDVQSSMGIHSNRQEVSQENRVSLSNNVSNSSRSTDYEKTLYESKAEIKKRESKQNAKQPLNSACKCESGKKYKNCCIKKL